MDLTPIEGYEGMYRDEKGRIVIPHTDYRGTWCPECNARTSVHQIAEWGTCEECRRRAEEQE
jgi:hypothetical protein